MIPDTRMHTFTVALFILSLILPLLLLLSCQHLVLYTNTKVMKFHLLLIYLFTYLFQSLMLKLLHMSLEPP